MLYQSLIILIIIVCWYYTYRSTYTNFLAGTWVSTEAFNKSADISAIMLYIGKPTYKWTQQIVHESYIVIMNDIYDGGLTISYTMLPYINTFNVVFADDSQLWPKSTKIILDIPRGELVIFDDDTVYAKLVKNHEISNFVN